MAEAAMDNLARALVYHDRRGRHHTPRPVRPRRVVALRVVEITYLRLYDIVHSLFLGVIGGAHFACFFDNRWSHNIRNATWLRFHLFVEVLHATTRTSPLNPTDPVTRMPGTELIRYNFVRYCPNRPDGGWTHGGLLVDAGDYAEVPLYFHAFLRFISLTQRNVRQQKLGLDRSIVVVLIVKAVLSIPPSVELLASTLTTTLDFNANFVRMDGAPGRQASVDYPEKLERCQPQGLLYVGRCGRVQRGDGA